MNSNIARQRLIKGVQSAFTERYPYLRINMLKDKAGHLAQGSTGHGQPGTMQEAMEQMGEEEIRQDARRLLWERFGLSDDSMVGELEVLLEYEFGRPVQILRKSGNLWLETRMTRHWTLRQQNDHGHDIALGFT